MRPKTSNDSCVAECKFRFACEVGLLFFDPWIFQLRSHLSDPAALATDQEAVSAKYPASQTWLLRKKTPFACTSHPTRLLQRNGFAKVAFECIDSNESTKEFRQCLVSSSSPNSDANCRPATAMTVSLVQELRTWCAEIKLKDAVPSTRFSGP